MPEIVQNNVNGLLVEAGNTQELVARVSEVMLNPVKSRLLGENARSAYRTHYTPAINYNQLMDIYLQAVLTNSSQMLHQADAMIVSQL
jgi:glycosyltransferase involved in cell wall biosynthesis